MLWAVRGAAIAAAAEFQWAIAFFGTGDLVQAILVIIAGLGLASLALGLRQDGIADPLAKGGLALAGAAHVAYVFSWGGFSPTLGTLASVGVAAGLAIAGGAIVVERAGLVRAGLATAAVGAAIWIPADVMDGIYGFMLGNVAAAAGWALTAWALGRE